MHHLHYLQHQPVLLTGVVARCAHLCNVSVHTHRNLHARTDPHPRPLPALLQAPPTSHTQLRHDSSPLLHADLLSVLMRSPHLITVHMPGLAMGWAVAEMRLTLPQLNLTSLNLSKWGALDWLEVASPALEVLQAPGCSQLRVSHRLERCGCMGRMKKAACVFPCVGIECVCWLLGGREI